MLGGLLIAGVGPGSALALDAATFAVSAVFLLALRLPAAAAAAREPSTFVADLREGWGVFRSMTWVWAIVLAAALGNMIWAAWSVLGPVIAERSLGGAAAWGFVLGAMGVGALLGSIVAIRARPERPLVWATIAYGLVVFPLAFLASGVPLAILAIGGLLGGLSSMLGNTIWEATLQSHVPEESLGRVSAYDWFGSMAFNPVGMAIWGPIAAGIGVSTALWVAVVVLACISGTLLATPAIRQLRA